jgi:hypothetical protein
MSSVASDNRCSKIEDRHGRWLFNFFATTTILYEGNDNLTGGIQRDLLFGGKGADSPDRLNR